VAEGLGQSWVDDPTARAVERVVDETPSLRQLDRDTRHSIARSLATVIRALGPDPGAGVRALAGVGDLRGRMGGGSDSGDASQAPGGDGTAAPATGTPAAPGGAATPGGAAAPAGPTSRVGEVARATLNAIDFPSFVAGLIQGTFQAIVDASIQQMEAYAELLKNVAVNVDKFMSDNITEESARDYLADQYDTVFARDTSNGGPKLTVRQDGDAPEQLPSFLSDLGFESVNDLDDDAVTNVVVPAARRGMAETRQQTLATMVMMGINRILVDDGEIDAKLQFHVDASETTKIRFDQKKTTNGTISGRAGRNPFGATAIMVNTVNLNAQTDLNVRADLTGEVKVKFRSEAFPLERFADSSAIQLINRNARVPEVPAARPAPGTAAPALPSATPGGVAATGAPAAVAPAAVAPAAVTPVVAAPMVPARTPAPAPAGTPAAQSLGFDPWMRP
jgi:hypothetical protein